MAVLCFNTLSIVKPLGIWSFMIYWLIWNFMLYDMFQLNFLKSTSLVSSFTKILLFNFGCNNWIISPRNHIFGRAIRNKLPECIFENFKISNFSKIASVIYFKNRPNQPCDYWFITPKQQTLCIETNIFKQWTIASQWAGNFKITPLTVQFRLQSLLWL